MGSGGAVRHGNADWHFHLIIQLLAEHNQRSGVVPVLEQVRSRHPFSLYVVGTDGPVEAKGIAVRSGPWALDREIQDFQSCDVGVYPLWDDEWSRGKCGFKAIQFMACGVPVVASTSGELPNVVGEAGLTFAEDDMIALATHLRRLHGDAALRLAPVVAWARAWRNAYTGVWTRSYSSMLAGGCSSGATSGSGPPPGIPSTG